MLVRKTCLHTENTVCWRMAHAFSRMYRQNCIIYLLKTGYYINKFLRSWSPSTAVSFQHVLVHRRNGHIPPKTRCIHIHILRTVQINSPSRFSKSNQTSEQKWRNDNIKTTAHTPRTHATMMVKKSLLVLTAWACISTVVSATRIDLRALAATYSEGSSGNRKLRGQSTTKTDNRKAKQNRRIGMCKKNLAIVSFRFPRQRCQNGSRLKLFFSFFCVVG